MLHLDLAEEISLGAATSAAGLYGMRPLFAKAAIHFALRKAAPAIKNFKESEASLFTHLTQNSHEAVSEFLKFTKTAKELRSTAEAAAAEMKVPELGKPQPLADLQKELQNIGESLLKIYSDTFISKVTSLLQDQVKHRAFKTAQELADSTPIDLSTIESGIVHALDNLGIIDLATSGHDFVVGHAADISADLGLDMLGDLSDVFTPGLLSGARSTFQEIKMVMNKETNWEDAFVRGIFPTAVKSGLVATGMAIDTAFGWTTLGLFTVLGYLGGRFFKNTVPIESIKADLVILKPFLDRIQDRAHKAVATINEAVVQNFQDFPALTKACPELSKEPTMQQFTNQIVESYKQDAKDAIDLINRNCSQSIQSLPARNWTDKLLGIDRSATVAILYRQAAKEITGNLAKASNNFDTATRIELIKPTVEGKTSPAKPANDVGIARDPEKVALALLNNPIFRNGYLIDFLTTLPNRLPKIQLKYYDAIRGWEAVCANKWITGMADITRVTKIENGGIDALSKELAPGMEPSRASIRANLKRLGKDPKLCP